MSASVYELSESEAGPLAQGPAWTPRLLWSAIGLLLCVLFAASFAYTLAHRERIGSTDFLQEWTSVRNWQTGRPIYAPLHETLPIYFAPGARCVVDLNAHPPTAVVLALPFGLLPYHEAWLWWNVANLIAAGGGLWLLLGRKGLNFSALAWIPVLLLVLSSNAIKEQVQLGQLNGWLLLLLVAAWRCDRAGKPWISGVCIGTAAAIKLFPGFVILYFLARRKWTACIAAALCFAVLTGCTALTLGWEAYRDYVVHVLPTLEQFRTSWLNASLHGFWTKLLVGRAERMVPLVHAPLVAQAAIGLSCVLITGVVLWIAGVARSRRARDVAFATTTIGMLLVSPITWDHYFLLLLPAIAILWRAQQRSGAARGVLAAVAIVVLTVRPGWVFGLVIPGPGEYAELLGMPAPLVLPAQTLTALAYPFYALATLFGLAVWTRSGLPPRRFASETNG